VTCSSLSYQQLALDRAHRVLATLDLAGVPNSYGASRALSPSGPARRPLRVLNEAGLVVDRRAGNRSIYRINPAGLAELRADLDRFWSSALVAYKTPLSNPTRRSHGYTSIRNLDPPRGRRQSTDRACVLGPRQ
jgi:hypothetical protein